MKLHYTSYCSLILSYITYCMDIWGNAYYMHFIVVIRAQVMHKDKLVPGSKYKRAA